MRVYNFKDTRTVKIRFFKKHLYGRIKNIDNVFSVFGSLDLSFNWVDYLSGVKIYDLPESPASFNSNLVLGIVIKKADQHYRPILATVISNDCFL